VTLQELNLHVGVK